jgi:hypothetical protein
MIAHGVGVTHRSLEIVQVDAKPLGTHRRELGQAAYPHRHLGKSWAGRWGAAHKMRQISAKYPSVVRALRRFTGR